MLKKIVVIIHMYIYTHIKQQAMSLQKKMSKCKKTDTYKKKCQNVKRQINIIVDKYGSLMVL